MSNCVNLNSKEFKDCCSRLNVSATTLEPIIHEFINIEGNENSFPSDVYIEERIHGNEQPVLSEEQVTLWEKRYSQPVQFDDVLEAMSYITETEIFFPRESIGLKETLDGKVEVRVTKPIYVGPNMSLEEFAREQQRQEQEWREVQQRDAIEEEKQQIKQKAIANGTFMKAPNGKTTNLTEDQWLSVRTKAFKEWFGDWEKIAPRGDENYDSVGGSPVALSYLLEGGPTTIINTGYLLHGISAAFELVTNEIEEIRNKYLSKIDDNPSNFKNDTTGALQEIKNIIDKTYGQQGLNILEDILNNATGFYIKEGTKVQDRLDALNTTIKKAQYRNVSKVVDENGEPKVVYHHTNNPDLKKFSTDFDNYFSQTGGIKAAIFFDENPSGTLERKYDIPVFLNIRNLKTYKGTKEDLHKQGTTYREVVANSAKEDSVFGGLHMTDFDDNKLEHQDVWIIHNSKQVKSAEYNTGYSEKEDSIYHENEWGIDSNAKRDDRLEELRQQEEVSIVDLLNLIDSNSEYSSIIELLKTKKQKGKPALLKGIKVKVVSSIITPYSSDVQKLEISRGVYRRAYYDAATKELIIDSDGRYNGGKADSVILHEIIHHITVNRIKSNTKFREEFDAIIDKYIEAFPYSSSKYKKDRNKHYIEEFIADIWSDKHTIEQLKSIKSDKKLTLWDRIKNFFVKIFSGSEGTLMADASYALYRLLDELETGISNDTFYENETRAQINPNEAQYITETFVPSETAKEYGLTESKLTGALNELKEIEDSYDTSIDKPITLNYSEYKNAVGEEATALARAIIDLAKVNNPLQYNKATKQMTVASEYYFKIAKHINTHKEFWDVIDNVEDSFTINSSDYYELGTLDSIFEVLEEFGLINYKYSDTRQKELFDENGNVLTQDEIDAKANKEAELDAVFQNTLQLTEQLKNIQDSGLISTSEFTQLANDVAYYISDLITSWQENPEEFKQSAPTLAAEIDVRTLSRRELVEKIGVPKLLEVVKKALFGKRIPGVDARKTLLLFKNFDALIRFGSSAFNTVEDFQISYSEIGYTVSDKVESTENENLSNEENAVIEENGDKQEHWQIDSRTVDTFLTMSQAVKKELARCYETNTDGSIKQNEFGINERISPRDATSCILRWTQGSLTLSDMILKLEGKQENNPWIKPIIEKLKDTSGKYSDFQSQFFGVFCKHFQEYYIVKEFNEGGNRVLRIMPVNRTPALNEIMTSIEVLFKLKAHPMFDNKGLIKEKLDNLKSYVNLLNEISTGDFNELPLDRVSKGIAKIADLLGYKTTDEMVILALTPESLYNIKKALSYIVSNLEKGLGDSNYNPFSFNKENKNGIRNNLKEFLQPLTEVLEDLAISSFFESGKMYQSYVIPSYMTKLMRKFQNSNEQEFKEFMQKEYGQYEWFRDQSRDIEDPNSWKNDWLRQLYFMNNENRKKLFGHKVQLSFVGHNYMRNMTGPEYVMAIMTEFFSGSKDSKETIIPTWYKIPMLSNKPSLEFIKFARYRGIGYEETILDGLQQVFIQELGRIIEVKNRAYSDKDDRHIKNFDTNGQKFCFLDFLNDYLGSKSHTELGVLLNKKIDSSEQLNIEEENKLFDLVRKEIDSFMTKKSNEIIQSYKNSGLFEAVKKIDGIGSTDAEIESNLKNFIWNDTYASMMILQMTITDIAYYANAEDLQKRLAQIHAPGIRPNVEAMDYGEYDEVGRLIRKAERVCDGNLRTIFLKDFEGDAVVQNVIENLEVVFSRKENESKTDAEKEYWKTTKEAIIDAFKDVNVTDAQAYNSITSYRKKAIMFGKWSSKNEEIYKKLKNKEWNISDLETIFQPLKPFVYTNSTKKSVGSKLKVGMQFKNAEYALLIADAILRNEDTGKPNLLKVLSEIMEESADRTDKRDKGIDTIMFASAVKAGLHGRLDIANFKDEKAAKDYLESKIYGDGADGYNETYVHTFPAEDYSIQQDYSPHFLEHSQADGSQKRMIIPSDLNPNAEYKVNGIEKPFTAEEFRKEYEETYAENIENSLNELEFELGLNLPTKKLRNIALSQVLQKEILSSPRYGIDLYIACSVDKDGNFNIPLGDPIQSKRIEQLINSIVKNRLNKQKIKGGPVIQVSNFGSTRLNIKFKDKKGNILPTLTEWLEKNPDKTAEDFKQFIADTQASVAYYECYAPAYMQEMFEDFMNERGFIDWEAINELEPEMLDMIGFRIPTEDLYSIAPMKIMGFLPKEAGEVIMMPYEVTVVWGSDKHHCFYPTK